MFENYEKEKEFDVDLDVGIDQNVLKDYGYPVLSSLLKENKDEWETQKKVIRNDLGDITRTKNKTQRQIS